MHKIALCGKLTADAKKMFYDECADRYEIVEILNETQIPLIRDAEYIVTRGVPFMERQIEELGDQTKLIHRWGVGYDSVDINTAAKRGIAVAICAGGNSQPVAEMTILLMLASSRKLTALIERAKEGTKDKEDIIAQSYLLQGKKVGLIGLGNIGSKVARMAQGFGAIVQYYDAFRTTPENEAKLGVTYTGLEELLQTSDIVSVHVPLMETTKHLLGAKEFAMMKDGALLVNTARGGIVDTDALLAALETGKLRGAALDTIEGEPLPKGHPIFSNEKVLLTPHGAGNTCDNNRNMYEIIRKNIDAMENGEMPESRYIVNWRELQY